MVSNQVSGSLRPVATTSGGHALCLDYNFNGVSGYVGIRRNLPIEYPDNYRLGFALRGESPSNDLQVKLIDASGDNVWWVNRPGFNFPKNWTSFAYRKRNIEKAWGPGQDKQLRSSADVEFTIYNKVGGKGSVCFDRLTLTPLPPEDTSPLKAEAITDTAPALEQRLADGKPETFWLSGAVKQQTVTLDLGKVREFGGAVVQWVPGLQASQYVVRASSDGRGWRDLRTVTAGAGGTDWLALPDTEARYLRFDLKDGPNWRYGIKEVQLQPLAFAATPNDFIKSLAAQMPRGSYPRGFSGEQPYWTILGLDGGTEQGLIGEDGAVEVGKGGFSIEPFVVTGGKLLHWSDVSSEQSLQDDYLPIPSVDWHHDLMNLRVTAFVQGTPDQAQLVARYQLHNTGKEARDFTLALAVRPFQVNPPAQFLNTLGGVSRIEQLAVDGAQVSVNGKPRVFAAQRPDAGFASAFDSGMDVSHLTAATPPTITQVKDETGLASGVLLYRWKLEPGQRREVALVIPQTGTAQLPAGFDADKAQQQVAQQWRSKLDRVRISVPAEGKPVVDTLRTALAHMLISRIGPRLQPGTRSYSRSWIRDGAMISEGLLRLGREDVVREYVDWFAPYQFDNGMVPCCVDDRGSDPVPENDSHGELIFNIAEYYRYTGDKAFLEKMWPHVTGAYDYMETLRASERTEDNFMRNPAFYGMMPVSISHEGYSAKPVHSYWDNFWALRGYKDAVMLAGALDKPDEVARFSTARDEFSGDLIASLGAAVRQHNLDFLPGSAEARRLRCDLDHHRAGTGWRAATPAAGSADQYLRALLEGVLRPPRQQARMEGLHAVRMAQRGRVRAPWLARPRLGRHCVLLQGSRAAAVESMGRSGLAHATHTVLRRRSAACLGRLGLRALGAGHVCLRPRIRCQPGDCGRHAHALVRRQGNRDCRIAHPVRAPQLHLAAHRQAAGAATAARPDFAAGWSGVAVAVPGHAGQGQHQRRIGRMAER